MSSAYFTIEVYGKGEYGCPKFDLIGYTDIDELIAECFDYYYQENSETCEK